MTMKCNGILAIASAIFVQARYKKKSLINTSCPMMSQFCDDGLTNMFVVALRETTPQLLLSKVFSYCMYCDGSRIDYPFLLNSF